MEAPVFFEYIDELQNQGVVGREDCPEEDYWHWSVLNPERLPDFLKIEFENYGEIRFYG